MNGNYYLVHKCGPCRSMDKPIHLGKSSIGWVFLIRGYLDGQLKGVPMSVHSMSDMHALCAMMTKTGLMIVNDADQEVSLDEFIEYVKLTKTDDAKVCEHSDVDAEGYPVSYEEFC